MTQIESRPMSSAWRAIRPRVGPMASAPPGQLNEGIWSPSFTRAPPWAGFGRAPARGGAGRSSRLQNATRAPRRSCGTARNTTSGGCAGRRNRRIVRVKGRTARCGRLPGHLGADQSQFAGSPHRRRNARQQPRLRRAVRFLRRAGLAPISSRCRRCRCCRPRRSARRRRAGPGPRKRERSADRPTSGRSRSS